MQTINASWTEGRFTLRRSNDETIVETTSNRGPSVTIQHAKGMDRADPRAVEAAKAALVYHESHQGEKDDHEQA